MNGLITITQLDRPMIDAVLKRADQFARKGYPAKRLSGKIVGSLFFEGSTRTRLSFDAAAKRLGAGVIGFASPEATSLATKGESFEDTIRMCASYADVLVVRHPDSGAAALAATVSTVPVINAGDGPNEHPTQTLLDLYAIAQAHGRIDGLTVGFVGDLKYSRVLRSLAQTLATHFPSVKQIWVAPKQLAMEADVRAVVSAAGIDLEETTDIAGIVSKLDILYMTRVQKERFSDKAAYEKLKDVYVLQPELLVNAKPNLKILHALPRRYEIPDSIDALPQAYYFQQAAGAVPVRAALLEHLIG